MGEFPKKWGEIKGGGVFFNISTRPGGFESKIPRKKNLWWGGPPIYWGGEKN